MLELLWGMARMIWGIFELIYEFFGGGSDRVRKKRQQKSLKQDQMKSGSDGPDNVI